ncbi:MAG: SMP-30/gluconolactonase/LRE family protein, partial [Myxococcales bacterium]|nr:SMP-30/gluconolactonase/LRE family protein [Myxococcales bacterium]
ANGVVFDPDRGLLFYTNYGSGRIARVPIDGGGQPGAPATVAMIDGRPDGLALDACGNLYAVDQMGSRLFRIWLDDAGAALGDPELLATFPTNVANAQFGRGPGWDAASIYAAGNPGDVYRLAVGVAGAPIP